MSSWNLYQFEDSQLKREALQSIVLLLNASGRDRDISVQIALARDYKQGLEASASRLADAVVKALEDSSGLILLDLLLYPESYADAGKILMERFGSEIPDLTERVRKVLREIPLMNQVDKFFFAGVVLVLAHHFGRLLFIASIVSERVTSDIISPELFLKFPDQPSDTAQVCSATCAIAARLGLDAKTEAEQRLVADRASLLAECVKDLLESLTLRTGQELSDDQLCKMNRIWPKLRDEARACY